ncbi:alpha/beta fold hydrolase [Streptomyces vilmorinianum]|uniref:alpha/beta fold hydrolase n=1 Tax=Streptomyces vilmorinianum TaxID=3051092 RepID=UPI0010FB7E33|nr:alpha/beta hydrolase [Streptomyces vilmorinianum]
MQLHTTTWGEGERVALLIHGIMADHRTWRRVGPVLAERGYRVVAVDLRGHGASGRAAAPSGYTPQDYADDLVETLPAGAELAIGHSLGGLTLATAVERLAPRRAVYVDPAWHLPSGPGGYQPELFTQAKSLTRDHIRQFNPRWEDEDLDIEVDSVRRWDERSAHGLLPFTGKDLWPARAVVPSLLMLADPSMLVAPERARMLEERGFELRTVAGAGHTIHRDDFDGFMTALQGWI